MKKISFIIVFIIGIGVLLFACYTFLYAASDIKLSCDEKTRTCVYEDIAPLKNIHKEFKYEEIKGGRVDKRSYRLKNSNTVYYYYVTCLILSNDEKFEVKRYEHEDGANELALKFNNIAKYPGYIASCNAEYKRSKERLKQSMVLVFMGLVAMVISVINLLGKT